MLECNARLAESKSERWHFAVSAAVLTMLFHVMLGTGFIKGTFRQALLNISRWCRLIKTEAPGFDYLEKEFYNKKHTAKRELLLWLDRWGQFLDKM
ncbi:hypothetical protein [Filimonas lacunae]|uniref:hypothetical protein n=1 Tax=Filimonas lacunae TaxID=477680 RepID=UPI0007D71771|nr:hypothetical protein [Filimonas lacunae]BAV09111.1 hypothetical protein FLA_5159 [Filimonas lacunae]